MKPARILIAQDPRATEVTTNALHDFDLVLVSTLQAAEYQIIEDGIDLFLLGIHFDDSRAIELVKIIRADAKHYNTPIIIVRFLPTTLGEPLRITTGALAKIGTISEYLEVEGRSDAGKMIREAVLKALPAEKVLA